MFQILKNILNINMHFKTILNLFLKLYFLTNTYIYTCGYLPKFI